MSRFVSAAAAAILVTGCGGAQLGRQNRVLHREVSSLRARTRDDRDQISDLDNQIVLLKEKLASATARAADPVPPLPVQVVQPPPPAKNSAAGAAPAGAHAAGGDSGVVYLTNVRDRGHQSALPADRRSPLRRRARPERTPAPAGRLPVWHGPIPAVSRRIAHRPRVAAARARAAAASGADVRSAYHRYYEALKAGNHAYAIAGFRAFIRRHPKSSLADNAQYWLGEAYYAQKKYQTALAEFQKVIQNYPHGNKVPDAMLKVAYCDQNLGDGAGARALLHKLVQTFPNTDPAALAVKRLEDLSEPSGGAN